MNDYIVENPREDLKKHLDAIREKYPDEANSIWAIFKQLKTPEKIIETVRDDKREKELEAEVKSLKEQINDLENVGEESEDVEDDDGNNVTYNYNFDFNLSTLIWTLLFAYCVYQLLKSGFNW